MQFSKCKFGTGEVKYLGFKLNAEGVYSTNDKVEAIIKAQTPSNITHLKSFSGLLNFHDKFLNNLSTVLELLNKLFRSSEKWFWGDEQKRAFQETKKMLIECPALMHFDPGFPIVVIEIVIEWWIVLVMVL